MSIDTIITKMTSKLLELPRPCFNERHFIVEDSEQLLYLCNQLQGKYKLFTMVVTDERLRIARTFKIYYVFSSLQEDEIILLEYVLPDPVSARYPSIQECFPNAAPLEQEILDMFGLIPDNNLISAGKILHSSVYPPDLYPLRRTKQMEKVLADIHDRRGDPREKKVSFNQLDKDIPKGMCVVPVGPIHAGVIEPGHFPFYIAGEVIEELPIRLGYKHRGIEKLFETHYSLENGWELAEKVSGDTSFAHSLAYCRAIERMVCITPSESVRYWRTFFLELERLYNHIADVGALAHDMAFERSASLIGVLREALAQMNQRLSGNRFLRGLNRPGGIVLPRSFSPDREIGLIRDIVDEFLYEATKVLENQECRERMLGTGILTQEEADAATGLVARASGHPYWDMRLLHPQDGYTLATVQNELNRTFEQENKEFSTRSFPFYLHDLQGDVLSRFALRVAEVETSANIIETLGKNLVNLYGDKQEVVPITDVLSNIPSGETGIGYAEGWRGGIVYFIVKGARNTIFRCKVLDPSVFNWYVFPKAVIIKNDEKGQRVADNILADFPLINKSFNLSYAGHDL